MAKHRQTTSCLLDVIKQYAYGNPTLRSKLTKEMKLFRNDEHDFRRVSAVSDRNVMLPDEPPTLTADELESFLRELTSFTIQEPQNIDDTLNLDESDDIEKDENDNNEVVGRVTNVGPSNENEIDELDFGTDWGSSSSRGNQWNIEHP
ncbi:hypothetical protein Acr_00g0092730 [Actinidia rufa]|uniref:Uncharacterized protein n=1 Tax=Actinidia rufa TaxID=165716 RepID=A0A7J0DXS6_9ERIC|nr:hypothetical protein Acr_00g0092730 [Actinidia rufa]